MTTLSPVLITMSLCCCLAFRSCLAHLCSIITITDVIIASTIIASTSDNNPIPTPTHRCQDGEPFTITTNTGSVVVSMISCVTLLNTPESVKFIIPILQCTTKPSSINDCKKDNDSLHYMSNIKIKVTRCHAFCLHYLWWYPFDVCHNVGQNEQHQDQGHPMSCILQSQQLQNMLSATPGKGRKC